MTRVVVAGLAGRPTSGRFDGGEAVLGALGGASDDGGDQAFALVDLGQPGLELVEGRHGAVKEVDVRAAEDGGGVVEVVVHHARQVDDVVGVGALGDVADVAG